MFIADIKRVVEQVSRDKGIDTEILIRALEEALRSAARKKFGSKVDIEAQYSPETGEIEVFQFKEVVETVTEPDLQISMEEGRKLDPDCEVGDSLGTKMDTSTFGRIAAQSAKQVIIQKMKDAERDAVYSSYIDRKGEVINGIVQRVDRGGIIVNLGSTEAILPSREQIPKETYRRGDRIRAIIRDVLYDTRGPQIVLSRTHPDLLISLFRTEVPEISEGIVEVKGAAREPGSRAKFAVSSNDSDIDPVGACVGMKGSRVQNVVQELRGEKIDIVTWHVDAARYVCNALAPAEIARVIIDEENKAMEVIVPDEFLSVAIGKRGQNVRLASKLTGWHLDVNSESRYTEQLQAGYASLMELPDVDEALADALVQRGIYSAEELSDSVVDEFADIPGLEADRAAELIDHARRYMADASARAAQTPVADETAEAESEEAESEDHSPEDQP
ncbi:transcription termination factor NusA [Desulfosarcina sp. OttesenSCG-928-G10]|nr:transcription termination factor NusA [Desulfosarcina sp. OttesenSCG-928-G10]